MSIGENNLAAGGVLSSVKPVQLYAGEKQVVTTQGIAKAGNVFGALNAQNHTSMFALAALVSGLLVPWSGATGTAGADATATVTLSTAVPVDGDKVTINGVDLVFETVPDVPAIFDPVSGIQVQIGATLAATATNLAAAINANSDNFGAPNGVTATVAGAVVTVHSAGTSGNAVTLAATFVTGANVAISASPLAGGVDPTAQPAGAARVYCLIPHYLDTSATGYNANVETPVVLEAVINFEALQLPAGVTYAEVKAACAGMGLVIQKLY